MFFKKKSEKKALNPSSFTSQKTESMSQAGKSFEEILPYLVSGESDDLSNDFTMKLQ